MRSYLLNFAYWLKSVGLKEQNYIIYTLGNFIYKKFRKDLYFN